MKKGMVLVSGLFDRMPMPAALDRVMKNEVRNWAGVIRAAQISVE